MISESIENLKSKTLGGPPSYRSFAGGGAVVYYATTLSSPCC